MPKMSLKTTTPSRLFGTKDEDNDLLFIRVTSQVDINDIGIFQINGKNFVKKLKRDYNGGWYFQSLNNSYEEIHLTENDDIRTIGEVVSVYREK